MQSYLAQLSSTPDAFRWLLYAGVGLLGFWLVLRLVLALTNILVKVVWVAGLILVVVWVVSHAWTG